MNNAFRMSPVIVKLALSFIVITLTIFIAVGGFSQTSNQLSAKGQFTFVDGQARKQKIGDEDWQNAQQKTPVGSVAAMDIKPK